MAITDYFRILFRWHKKYKQAIEGLSLLNQERAIREYCVREHLELVRLFEDRSVSAGTSNRPGFQEALAYCAEHSEDISAFIVYDLSRFARNAQDQLALHGYLKGLGIQLISTCERTEQAEPSVALRAPSVSACSLLNCSTFIF